MISRLLRVLARGAYLRALGLFLIALLTTAGSCDNGSGNNGIGNADPNGDPNSDPNGTTQPSADDVLNKRVTQWMYAVAGADADARDKALTEIEAAAAKDPAVVAALLDRIETDAGFTAHIEEALRSGRDDDAVIALDFIRTHKPLPDTTLRALVAYAFTAPHLAMPIDGVAQALGVHGNAGAAALEHVYGRVAQGDASRRHDAIAAKLPWRTRYAVALAHVADPVPPIRLRARAVVDELLVSGDAKHDRAAIEAAIARIATLTQDGRAAGLPNNSTSRDAWALIRDSQAWLLQRLESVRITPVVDGNPPGSGRVAWFYPALLKARVEGHYMFFPDQQIRSLAWVAGPKRRDVLDVCRRWLNENAGKYTIIGGAGGDGDGDAPLDDGAFHNAQLLVNTYMPEDQLMAHGSPRHAFTTTADPGFEPSAATERKAAARLAEADGPISYQDWPPAFTPLSMGDVGEAELALWQDAVVDPAIARRERRSGRLLGDWAPIVTKWCPIPPTVRALAAIGEPAKQALASDARSAVDWRFEMARIYLDPSLATASANDLADSMAWHNMVGQRWRFIQVIDAELVSAVERADDYLMSVVGFATYNDASYRGLTDNTAAREEERMQLLDPVARLIAGLAIVQWQVALRYAQDPYAPENAFTRFADVEAIVRTPGIDDVAFGSGDFVRFALGPKMLLAPRVGALSEAQGPPALSGYRWRAEPGAFDCIVDCNAALLAMPDEKLTVRAWRTMAVRAIRIAGALVETDEQRERARKLATQWLARSIREVRVAALEAMPLPDLPADALALIGPFLDDADEVLVAAAAIALLSLPDGDSDRDPSAAIDRAAPVIATRMHDARTLSDGDAAARLLQAVAQVERVTPALADAMLALVGADAGARATSEAVRVQVQATLSAWYPRGVGADPLPTGAAEVAERVRDVAVAIARDTERSERERAAAVNTAVRADDFGEGSLALVRDLLRDAAWPVQEAALQALMRRSHDADIPTLCEVLPDLPNAHAQRDLIRHLQPHTRMRKDVVTAFLPFLRTQLDDGFTGAQRDMALNVDVLHPLLNSNDPRISPALAEAVLERGFDTIDASVQSYLVQFPSPRAWELFVEVIRGERNSPGASHRFAIDYLVGNWDRGVMLDAVLQLWADARTLQALGSITRVFETVRYNNAQAEFRWIRAIAARDYADLIDIAQPFAETELPLWDSPGQAPEFLGVIIRDHLSDSRAGFVINDAPQGFTGAPNQLPGETLVVAKTGLEGLRQWLSQWR